MANPILFGNCILREAGEETKIKNYDDSYLYHKSDSGKRLMEFMLTCHHVDKSSESFQEIRSDVKRRQINASTLKVLDSPQVILCIGDNPLPKANKVMAARDVRGDKNKLKIFIDVTELIKFENGVYKCDGVKELSVLVGYLLIAMNTRIYFTRTTAITNRTNLTKAGCRCFSDMVTYILDYLRIMSGTNKAKEKIKWYASMYYQVSLLGKDADAPATSGMARKIAGISEQEEKMIQMYIDTIANPYINIDTFVNGLRNILNCSTLTLESFVNKWMFLFGPGTQYGLELYPDFARILIEAYVGSYQNNQATIEKVLGGAGLSEFVNEILSLGMELVK